MNLTATGSQTRSNILARMRILSRMHDAQRSQNQKLAQSQAEKSADLEAVAIETPPTSLLTVDVPRDMVGVVNPASLANLGELFHKAFTH
jgi:hypothetical protein